MEPPHNCGVMPQCRTVLVNLATEALHHGFDQYGATRPAREYTAETTVTEIATRDGFWQPGRLAVEYKALFGKASSATLAHPL